MMTITARFSGRCSKCSESIIVGSKILWARGAGSRHLACGSELDEEARKLEAEARQEAELEAHRAELLRRGDAALPRPRGWDPVAEPYRVCFNIKMSAFPYWTSRCESFATLEQAVARASEKFPAGVSDAQIDLALNPATWTRNGSWKSLGRRQRKQAVQLYRNAK